MTPAPDPARSDEALRALGDLLVQMARESTPATGGGPLSGDVVLPVAGTQQLMFAATVDEAGRVLGALAQIRGPR